MVMMYRRNVFTRENMNEWWRGEACRLPHKLSFRFLELGIFSLQVVDGTAFILALEQANYVVSYCLLMCS